MKCIFLQKTHFEIKVSMKISKRSYKLIIFLSTEIHVGTKEGRKLHPKYCF